MKTTYATLKVEELENTWEERLTQSGYRVTERCRAIIKAITRSNRALDPLAIFDIVRKDYPKLGLMTVYRTIQKLEDLGLLQKMHHPDGCHMVLPSLEGHRHLIICARCGAVASFEGDDLSRLFLSVENESGFMVEDHWLQLFGLCKDCLNTKMKDHQK